MDNMGVGGGGSNTGAVFGSPETGSAMVSSPSGEVDNTWTKPESANVGEIHAPSVEMAPGLAESQESSNSEKIAEQQSSAMPIQAPMTALASQDPDDIAVAEAQADLEGIHVRRDSEALPKAYMQAVSKIINRNRKDPHRLVTELDVARWDMMSKAFNRKLGDGLNGRGLSE